MPTPPTLAFTGLTYVGPANWSVSSQFTGPQITCSDYPHGSIYEPIKSSSQMEVGSGPIDIPTWAAETGAGIEAPLAFDWYMLAIELAVSGTEPAPIACDTVEGGFLYEGDIHGETSAPPGFPDAVTTVAAPTVVAPVAGGFDLSSDWVEDIDLGDPDDDQHESGWVVNETAKYTGDASPNAKYLWPVRDGAGDSLMIVPRFIVTSTAKRVFWTVQATLYGFIEPGGPGGDGGGGGAGSVFHFIV